MSLLERLKAGTRNEITVKFPGTDQDVKIRVLSEQEIQEAEFDTERLFKTAGIEYSASTVDAYEKEKTLQLLHRSMRDPDGNPFTASVDELRKLLTQNEKDALVTAYLQLDNECNPAMTEKEFSKLLSDVKKRPVEIVSSISNIGLLQKLVISLASRPASSRKASGSTSS